MFDCLQGEPDSAICTISVHRSLRTRPVLYPFLLSFYQSSPLLRLFRGSRTPGRSLLLHVRFCPVRGVHVLLTSSAKKLLIDCSRNSCSSCQNDPRLTRHKPVPGLGSWTLRVPGRPPPQSCQGLHFSESVSLDCFLRFHEDCLPGILTTFFSFAQSHGASCYFLQPKES